MTSSVEVNETPGAVRLTGYFVPTFRDVSKSKRTPVGETCNTRSAVSHRTFNSYCSGFNLAAERDESVLLLGRPEEDAGGSVFLSATIASGPGQTTIERERRTRRIFLPVPRQDSSRASRTGAPQPGAPTEKAS